MVDPSSKDLRQDNTSSSNKIDTPLKRPRLNYLRSAWTTNDLYYHESTFNTNTTTSTTSLDATPAEDNIYQIRLPPFQLQDSDQDEEEQTDEILTQVFCMISIANITCLFGSITSTLLILHSVPCFHLFIQHPDWMPHVILPFYVLWWFIMITVLNHRKTEHLTQYLNWTQLSTVIMTITHLATPITHYTFQYYHLFFVSSSLISFFIYAFSKRIVIANEQLQDRYKKRITEQYDKLQQVVDTHSQNFNNHRSTFLATVSQEIQDVALMVITTLEQFSPSTLLSNAQELLSACSIAVPTASISAINTTIRQVCHVSSHLELLSKLTVQAWTRSNINLLQLPELVLAEFDIGELLQNLGDALAGLAAKLDVNLVIYHCDNNLHHTLVIGDEGAIRHALLNHIRNVLECCTPGASIEVGLNVAQIQDPNKVKITFYITHTSSPAIRNANAALLPNANLTAQLLTYINASCTIDADTDHNRTKFEFSFELDCSKKERTKMFLNNDSHYLLKNHYANIKFANEPSLKDLNTFIENLKGLKMVLHAPEHSIFAKHLTSCLASWNTDISHVPVAPLATTVETDSASVSSDQSDMAQRPVPTTPPVPSPAIEEEHIHSIPPAFILIDDDIATLESKLGEFRTQPPASANVLQQAHHGRRHYYKKSNFFHQGTTAIIHFTSLTKYKAVRETIQCYAFLPSRDPFSMPRVVVVPKPAGPRRFLTALHTAWNNSVVEPHFSAIATSPSSPMPPMISMLVQREIAAATSNVTSPSDAPKVSPSNESPGARARRPLSGIFSPPIAGDNYFSQPTSNRRRSTHTPEADYLTAKTPLVATEPELVQPETKEVPVEPAVENTVELLLLPENAAEEAVPDVPIFKKKMGRTMSNFKMHKKKRKDRGTPFADVVSPPINVLIVEDNIINQAILSAWMKKHKIKFSVASNGLEAMDIQLPVMNGIEATKMIRSIEKEQKIGVLPMSSSFLRHQQEVAAATAETFMNQTEQPKSTYEMDQVAAEMMLMNTADKSTPSIFRSPVIIVALTASSLESDRHAALAAGCNDFLTKPVSLEWLEKKIIEWGCMQALIDFEGWRRWKKNAEDNNSNVIKKKLASFTSKAPMPTNLTREQLEAEKKRIEEKSKSPKSGIMLPGVSNLIKQRRFSTTTVLKKRNKLKPSRSESDTDCLNGKQQQDGLLLNHRSRSISKEKKFDTESYQDTPHFDKEVTKDLDDSRLKKSTVKKK
ncbi:hypothetical protein BDF21DRAFT_345846 [Thamnidium elegans]|nr:hypothetical protein BDF21DRAFT_345846 [Thamnidium elegans]